MQKSNVIKIIRELALEYIRNYNFTTEKALAGNYFDARTELDIERDENAGVTFEDYVAAVKDAWLQYNDELSLEDAE